MIAVPTSKGSAGAAGTGAGDGSLDSWMGSATGFGVFFGRLTGFFTPAPNLFAPLLPPAVLALLVLLLLLVLLVLLLILRFESPTTEVRLCDAELGRCKKEKEEEGDGGGRGEKKRKEEERCPSAQQRWMSSSSSVLFRTMGKPVCFPADRQTEHPVFGTTFAVTTLTQMHNVHLITKVRF